jgi:hypothetical protein
LGISLFTTASIPVLGPTLAHIQWVIGALSLGVKLPGREADHSPPFIADVNNAWNYTLLPQSAFMAWCSVKAQGQLYLTSEVINRGPKFQEVVKGESIVS